VRCSAGCAVVTLDAKGGAGGGVDCSTGAAGSGATGVAADAGVALDGAGLFVPSARLTPPRISLGPSIPATSKMPSVTTDPKAM
jgi:hypothetical protein